MLIERGEKKPIQRIIELFNLKYIFYSVPTEFIQNGKWPGFLFEISAFYTLAAT